MIPGIRIFLGLLLLLLGRRLYWIMVGVGGLLVGMAFTEQILADRAPPVRFLVAVGAGLLGMLLAVLAQRVAFALLGFFAGGHLALLLSQSAFADATRLVWFVLGGMIGAVIAALVMDWGIIVLTSLAGAATIVASFSMKPVAQTIIFVVLAGIGIVIQGRSLKRANRNLDTPSR